MISGTGESGSEDAGAGLTADGLDGFEGATRGAGACCRGTDLGAGCCTTTDWLGGGADGGAGAGGTRTCCVGVPVLLTGVVDTLSFDTHVANRAPTAITAATAAAPKTTPGRLYTGNCVGGRWA